ncbi:MAG TPA: hypothetical protein VKA46_06035 [Gemmataceae bacterium]|nr:hypothetical protein [Gemmataceae bacterium]
MRGGRLWLADYARAGGSHFVAVAEQPYPWEVHFILCGAAAGTAVALGAAVRWGQARLRRARPALRSG